MRKSVEDIVSLGRISIMLLSDFIWNKIWNVNKLEFPILGDKKWRHSVLNKIILGIQNSALTGQNGKVESLCYTAEYNITLYVS